MKTAQRHTTNSRRARGFSLLELTLVLVILGILGSVAAVNVLGQGERAKIRATETSMQTISAAIDDYILSNSESPPTLQALVTSNILKAGSLEDGWGRPFGYRPTSTNPDRRYELWSNGPDPDDVTDNIDIHTMQLKNQQ